jgi:hypothetical protein
MYPGKARFHVERFTGFVSKRKPTFGSLLGPQTGHKPHCPIDTGQDSLFDTAYTVEQGHSVLPMLFVFPARR